MTTAEGLYCCDNIGEASWIAENGEAGMGSGGKNPYTYKTVSQKTIQIFEKDLLPDLSFQKGNNEGSESLSSGDRVRSTWPG